MVWVSREDRIRKLEEGGPVPDLVLIQVRICNKASYCIVLQHRDNRLLGLSSS
jgi:hypothetical protein